ncbi:MAG: hypothetical protein DRN20_06740 [Thermoplasmata archaeon]|mgnify:CR=1 FL=1|nr:MAG: hypothetical protein DRN20_06740 [Thermoplasmata archaeon]
MVRLSSLSKLKTKFTRKQKQLSDQIKKREDRLEELEKRLKALKRTRENLKRRKELKEQILRERLRIKALKVKQSRIVRVSKVVGSLVKPHAKKATLKTEKAVKRVLNDPKVKQSVKEVSKSAYKILFGSSSSTRKRKTKKSSRNRKKKKRNKKGRKGRKK